MHAISRRGWIALLAVVAATSAVTATATTALANHQFNDGDFRPGDPTTRGQFTFWLNNCGGRVSLGDGTKSLTGSTQQTLASAQMTAGALPTGGGFIVALASVQASASNCTGTCVVEFRLKKDAVIKEVASLAVTNFSPDSGSVQSVIPVNGGTDSTYELVAVPVPSIGTDTVQAEGSVTLLYVPFAGDGTGGGQEGD
jgi:hypothetical protein